MTLKEQCENYKGGHKELTEKKFNKLRENAYTINLVKVIGSFCESILDTSKKGYPCDGDSVAREILEIIKEENEK